MTMMTLIWVGFDRVTRHGIGIGFCDSEKKNQSVVDLINNVTSLEIDFEQLYSKVCNPNTPESLLVQFGCGYMTGLFIKKSMKVAIVTIGGALTFLQYQGYIQVDNERIKNEMNWIANIVSNNKDEIMTMNKNTINASLEESKNLLGIDLPPGSGFIPGCLLGFKKG